MTPSSDEAMKVPTTVDNLLDVHMNVPTTTDNLVDVHIDKPQSVDNVVNDNTQGQGHSDGSVVKAESMESLSDLETLIHPSDSEIVTRTSSSETPTRHIGLAPVSKRLVNINTANKREIMNIDQIGPKTANKILRSRPEGGYAIENTRIIMCIIVGRPSSLDIAKELTLDEVVPIKQESSMSIILPHLVNVLGAEMNK